MSGSEGPGKECRGQEPVGKSGGREGWSMCDGNRGYIGKKKLEKGEIAKEELKEK